jgi:hypothetical protein
MLKFFRRIRKGLLESGKIRNYTLYAIGEIALVVVGILIALQISNWNEQRNEKTITNGYLIALKGEFQTNILELDRAILVADTVLMNAAQFFPTTNAKLNLTEKETNIFISKTISLVQFESKAGVINDIINSGKIALLKNDTLRNFISSWEGLINKLQQREEGLLKRQDWLTEFIIENGNNHKTGYYTDEKRIPKSRFEKGNLPLLEMATFEGIVSGIAGSSARLKTLYYPQFKEKLEQQITIIDRELE